jgi:hypothetical protein
MTALHAKLDADRRHRMRGNATRRRGASHLRAGVTPRGAVDVLWALSSPDLFLRTTADARRA